MHSFTPRGVCSKSIEIELDGDTVSHVEFQGGCNGNLQAVSRLVQGKTVDEVSDMLEGITCGPRKTSCADQLVQALKEAREQDQ